MARLQRHFLGCSSAVGRYGLMKIYEARNDVTNEVEKWKRVAEKEEYPYRV